MCLDFSVLHLLKKERLWIKEKESKGTNLEGPMSCRGRIMESRRNLSIHCGKRVASGTWKSTNYLLFFISYPPYLKMISDCVVEQVLNHIISDSELPFADPVKECRKFWISNNKKEGSLTFNHFLLDVLKLVSWVCFFTLFLDFWKLR